MTANFTQQGNFASSCKTLEYISILHHSEFCSFVAFIPEFFTRR